MRSNRSPSEQEKFDGILHDRKLILKRLNVDVPRSKKLNNDISIGDMNLRVLENVMMYG